MTTLTDEIELNRINELKLNMTNLSNNDFDVAFLNIVGTTLIQLQIAEFALLGAISYLNENLLKLDKKFEKLNPERFISNNKEDSIYRKQTLGALIKFVNEKVTLFDIDVLDTFLNKRNDFVHNFFRHYLSHDRNNIRSKKTEAFYFVISLYEESIKWTSIFKGFLYEIAIKMIQIRNNPSDSIAQFDHLKNHHHEFLISIKDNK